MARDAGERSNEDSQVAGHGARGQASSQGDPRLTVRLTAWKLWGLTAPPEAVKASITAASDPLVAETLALAEGKNMQGPRGGRRRDAR